MEDEQPLTHGIDRTAVPPTSSPDDLNPAVVLPCGKELEPGDHVIEIDSRVTCEGCIEALGLTPA